MKCACPIITLRSGLGFAISTVFSSIRLLSLGFSCRMIIAVAVGQKGSRKTANDGELPGYFHRLPARAQRAWLKSDSIDRFDLVPDAAIFSLTAALIAALPSGAPLVIERAA